MTRHPFRPVLPFLSAFLFPWLASATGNGEWQDADLRPMMGSGEQFQSTALVTVAYAFIWVMVTGFVVTVWLRSRRLGRELADLERRIARAGNEPRATNG